MVEILSDLYDLVLKRLPSKPLLKFLTVSKSWYSLIKSPNFIKSHHNHHKSHVNNNHHHHHPFVLKSQSGYSVVRYRNPRRVQLPSPPREFNIISASPDGLFCLFSSYKSKNLLLWNPAINRYKRIEPPFTGLRICAFGLGLGLGFDELVLISSNEDYYSADGVGYTSLSAHVYNQSLGWKNNVSIPVIKDCVYCFSGACYVNDDNMNWIMFRGFYDRFLGPGAMVHAASLLRFDARNHTFKEMQLPRLLKKAHNPNMSLAAIGDSLAVVQLFGKQKNLCFGDEQQPVTSVRVWRMEAYGVEESWKLVYRIKLSSVLDLDLLAEEDDKVLITTSSGRIVEFNVNNDATSGLYDGRISSKQEKAFVYRDSLVFLDGLQRQQLEA